MDQFINIGVAVVRLADLKYIDLYDTRTWDEVEGSGFRRKTVKKSEPMVTVQLESCSLEFYGDAIPIIRAAIEQQLPWMCKPEAPCVREK
jgi:hypothetical protein